METEYEAKFSRIDKKKMRERLRRLGAELVQPEFLQRRFIFFPADRSKKFWLRVRDEGRRVTLSLKSFDGGKISDQKELELIVDDFEKAVAFLRHLNFREKSYQENKRETWCLDGAVVTLDEWPYLEPFVEIEGQSEDQVRAVSQKLGFDYNQAIFGPVFVLASRQYGLSVEVLNEQIPRLTFNEPNPFWLCKIVETAPSNFFVAFF